MRSPLRPVSVAILAIAAVATTTAACSSSGAPGHGGPKLETPLAHALAQVADTATTRQYIEFGQPKAATQANGGATTSGPYQRAIGYGASDLFPSYRIVQEALGIDLTTADYAISAGQPPKAGGLVSGLQLGAAGAKLEALGAQKSGTSYRLRADNRIDLGDKLGAAIPGVVNALNVVDLDGSDLRHGASAAAVAQMHASGANLMSDASVAALASCLDNPLAAVITDKLPSAGGGRLPPSLVPTPSPGVRAVAVGLSGKAGTTPTEQMCVAADSKSHADQLATTVKQALANGMSLRTNNKWSAMLSGASVTVDGSTVKVTAHPVSGPGGLLLQALANADLPGVSG